MPRKFAIKTSKHHDDKAAKSMATNLEYQQIAHARRPVSDLETGLVNFTALRFCALALNSK